ncbi:MAG: hypothetical protein ACTSUE_23745 [Promethearchaeota archaeon]
MNTGGRCHNGSVSNARDCGSINARDLHANSLLNKKNNPRD